MSDKQYHDEYDVIVRIDSTTGEPYVINPAGDKVWVD
jgi:hypothetical protein